MPSIIRCNMLNARALLSQTVVCAPAVGGLPEDQQNAYPYGLGWKQLAAELRASMLLTAIWGLEYFSFVLKILIKTGGHSLLCCKNQNGRNDVPRNQYRGNNTVDLHGTEFTAGKILL